MAMQAESLEVLEKAEIAPAQARAIVRAIEIEVARAMRVLAVNQDLAELIRECREMTAELKAEIRVAARRIIRFMYLAMLAQMAVLSVFAYCLAAARAH